jgi:hypothetical protein
MAISAALSADLTTLTQALDYPGADVETLLRQLDDDTRTVVASYVGLRVTIVVDGDPVTLTTVRDLAQRDSIVSSLTLRLNALRASEPGNVLILYASEAGVFLNFAADITQAFRLGPDDVALDQDLTLSADQSDPSGIERHSVLEQRSVVNQAIGVLRGRGYTLDDARAELHRLARDTQTTVYAAAQRLIHAIGQRPAAEHRDNGSA